MYPVNRSRQVNSNMDEERHGSRPDQSFSQVLEEVKDESQMVKEKPKNEKLRTMGGLNQYNRHAVEFCFMLSSDTDFRA